jgi:hypothetical protein
VRYSWTIAALEQIHAQGISPREVHEVLAGPGPRLIQPINGRTRRVLARTGARRLIEVWLRESGVDEEYEVWTAFDAGMVGRATWKNAFGEGGDQ